MARTEPAQHSATELLTAYAEGSLSPVEVVEDVLTRIDEHDAAVNAYCLVDHERALQAARASQERWARGQPAGRLDGVPTSVKDLFHTRDWPTLRGSRTIDPDQPWREDAPVTALLRADNAVLIGKTTTPELAWKGVTDSPRQGITRNPWDPARTAGGSSGGAAAAVAAAMAPLAVGTDGGGSVRIPASFCGIATLKPTYGRIPLYPASPFGTLSHAGPMTTTVADCALLLDVLAQPDPRDWSVLPAPAEPFAAALTGEVDGLRIAVSTDLGFAAPVDPQVQQAVLAAAETFDELGAIVEHVDPGISDPVTDFHVLWFAGAAKATEHLSESQRELLDPGLAEICRQGAEFSAMDYLEAVNTRMLLGQRMAHFHGDHDLLLTPTVPIPPFEAGREVPSGSASPRWTSWTPFTYPFNMTQQPAASVPCGRTAEGLPIGLQIIGARHDDATVLRAAHAFEQARPWQRTTTPVG